MLTRYTKLELAETHKIGKEEMKPPTLGKLVSMGVQDPQVSNDVFMALVKELSMPGRYVDPTFLLSASHRYR